MMITEKRVRGGGARLTVGGKQLSAGGAQTRGHDLFIGALGQLKGADWLGRHQRHCAGGQLGSMVWVRVGGV
jgi:hypothetical protein